MKRIMLVALVFLCVQTAWADEPKELIPPGTPAGDAAVAIINAMNRQMKTIEDEADLVTKSADFYVKLMESEQKLQAERKKMIELDKKLEAQQNDLLADLKSRKAGQSDAEVDKLEKDYKARKKELDKARQDVKALPAKLKELGEHIGDQAKLLKQVKSMTDWVDPRTGKGRLRAAFQKRRYKINDLTDKIGKTTAEVKSVLEKGSTLDVKVEQAGAFEGRVTDLSSGTPAFEWIVNGKKVTKTSPFVIGDDRVIRLQVKLVDDRRKQSRTIKDGNLAKKTVTKEDYDFEYGVNESSTSHWVITEEEYSDWMLDQKSTREVAKVSSTSGVFATVKGDVYTITLSPNAAADRIHVSVIGRLTWEMTGKRAGNPSRDKVDSSGNASIDLEIKPSK